MCTIKIGSVTAVESGGQVASVTVEGKAVGCSQIRASFTCQGNVISKVVPVDPGGGAWKAIFDASDNLVVAECECGGPVRVEAVCVDDPNCADTWKGELDCEEARRCEIKITSVMGTESGGQVTSVIVLGQATECSRAKVSFTCRGNVISEVAPVDSGGNWKAVFDAADKLAVAECECDGPVHVKAVCVDDPNCADTWEGDLDCEEARRCEIKITSVTGTESGGQVTSVTVLGKAANCSKVEVTFTCQGQGITTVVPVDPGSGTWKAVFDAADELKLAECKCDGPVRVRAVCLDDPECVDKREDELDCDVTTTTTTTHLPTTTTTTTKQGGGICGILSLAFLLVFASILLLIFSSPTNGLIAAGLAVTCLLVGVLAPAANE